MKLLSYVQSGKGRGIRLVCLIWLLLMLVFGGMYYYYVSRFLKDPDVQNAWNSVPTFTIQNGEIQDKTIRWRGLLPLPTRIVPLTIDTTQDEVSLPTPEGMYVTAKEGCIVVRVDEELRKQCFALPNSFEATGESLIQNVKFYEVANIVLGALFFLAFSLVFYLALVGLSALIGWISRLHLGQGRVWRSSALAWILGQLLMIVLSFVQLSSVAIMGIVFVASIVADLALLVWSKR